MKNILVYHIACMNDWVSIFNQQMSNIEKSGILDVIDEFLVVSLSQQEKNFYYIDNKIKKNKGRIVYKSSNILQYEFPAIDLIWNKSLHEKFKICYIHCKGVSITKNNMTFYHGSNDLDHLKSCVSDWRRYMEYFVINNYDKCLDILDEYDCCGVNLVDSPKNHYSGNFWWNKSDYIKKLTPIKNLNKNDRYDCEYWIGDCRESNMYNFYTNNAGYLDRLDGSYKIYDKQLKNTLGL